MEEELLKKIQGLIADSQKDGVKKADLDAKVEAINKEIAEKLDNAGMKALKENVDKLVAATAENAAAIKAMSEVASKKVENKPMTFKDALVNAVQEAAKNVPQLLTEKADSDGKRQSMTDYFNKLGNKNTPEMVVKIAVDMLESAIVQTNVNTVRLTELDPNRVGTPLTIYPHVVDWMPVKGISKKYMSILVVYTYVDGAGTKTQGSAPSQSSFLLKTVEFVSATIGTYFRLSDESLEDLPEAMEEIAIVGPSKIKDNIDVQILGAAGDDTATIKGLFAASKKTDFASATTYAGIIKQANLIDALVTMKLQGSDAKYNLDTVVLNPLDVHKIAAIKDQLDNSISDRRITFSTLGEPIAVGGMLIRKNAAMTANTAVALQTNMVQIGDRRSLTMEVGYDGNDFKEGYKTVRINARLAFAVRDAAAVVYCSDLSAAVSDINIV